VEVEEEELSCMEYEAKGKLERRSNVVSNCECYVCVCVSAYYQLRKVRKQRSKQPALSKNYSVYVCEVNLSFFLLTRILTTTAITTTTTISLLCLYYYYWVSLGLKDVDFKASR
jgi:hypothetical protein